MTKPSARRLQEITEAAHIPAVCYAYVEPKDENKHGFESTSLTFGKKSVDGIDEVTDTTRFPASSLSKIVFTYLVLQLVKDEQIDLDKPLIEYVSEEQIIPQYERFKINDKYPDIAKQLTARHILSHTTGLPNVGEDLSSTLAFDPHVELGKGYYYSGEAFRYLQQVIEIKTGKSLETLAKEYIFDNPDPDKAYTCIPPLGMKHSTFLPQPDGDTNIVSVHTQLEKSAPIQALEPHLDAAGSLLTTAYDFSKFMTAWLENMNDPIFQQAFVPTKYDLYFIECDVLPSLEFIQTKYKDKIPMIIKVNDDFYVFGYNQQGELHSTLVDVKDNAIYNKLSFTHEVDRLSPAPDEIVENMIANRSHIPFPTCGLGWHLYRDPDTNALIAYQYGENLNTRAFIAVNVDDKKAAAFFTNSESGMSIANQVLSSPDFAPIGNVQALFKRMPEYPQSDEPGWKETLAGMIAEDKGEIEKARSCFTGAFEAAPHDNSKKLRLAWFNELHPSLSREEQAFDEPALETFVGQLINAHEQIEIQLKDNSLIHKQFGQEIKLKRISENEFLPEKDQSFKIIFHGSKVTKHYIEGYEKSFTHRPSQKQEVREQTSLSHSPISFWSPPKDSIQETQSQSSQSDTKLQSPADKDTKESKTELPRKGSF